MSKSLLISILTMSFLSCIDKRAPNIDPSQCGDGQKNGAETDLDCGGVCSQKCARGQTCVVDTDCAQCSKNLEEGEECPESAEIPSVCDGGLCVAKPSCNDGAINQGETDVDCGGTSSCERCQIGQNCIITSDCKDELICNESGKCANPPTCDDQIKNGDETDVDCGGSCQTKCISGQACAGTGDCSENLRCYDEGATLICVGCDDQVKNGDETDVNCGGMICNPCGETQRCLIEADCQSGLGCIDGFCLSPGCTDDVKNGNETDVDCGGNNSGCLRCLTGQSCKVDSDCEHAYCGCENEGECELIERVCLPPTCEDSRRNGNETDVDCGKDCPKCQNNAHCDLGSDCQSGVCQQESCRAATCNDNTQNGLESGIDCGGATTCRRCMANESCEVDSDCITSICLESGFCAEAACPDGAKNGTETDVDCGGNNPSCRRCLATERCAIATDCLSHVCYQGECLAATCSDNIQNGSESDIDCGPAPCNGCQSGQNCSNDSHCSEGLTCNGGHCENTNCPCGSTVDGVYCGNCGPGGLCSAPDNCTTGVCTNGICQVATCLDLVTNGGETDMDCGGATQCDRCETNQHCTQDGDCNSLVCGCADPDNCPSTSCLAATCDDGRQNGDEIAVDCGGLACQSHCAINQPCNADNDCASGVCWPTGLEYGDCPAGAAAATNSIEDGFCLEPSHNDCRYNDGETDVDCGGEAPNKCAIGQMCDGNTDCNSSYCRQDGMAFICTVPSCNDNVKNGGESDVDCGEVCQSEDDLCEDGQTCFSDDDCLNDCFQGTCTSRECTEQDCVDCAMTGCQDGQNCSDGANCQSGVCENEVCQQAACPDTVKNGDESDIDCGGSDLNCPRCEEGKGCNSANDCLSKVCEVDENGYKQCQAASCDDGVQNGDETGQDCGGDCSLGCALNTVCHEDSDCLSQTCIPNDISVFGLFCDENEACTCVPPSCHDERYNGNETDIDCGGVLVNCPENAGCEERPCDACPATENCRVAADCQSGVCQESSSGRGICQEPACDDGMLNGDELVYVGSRVQCGGTCSNVACVEHSGYKPIYLGLSHVNPAGIARWFWNRPLEMMQYEVKTTDFVAWLNNAAQCRETSPTGTIDCFTTNALDVRYLSSPRWWPYVVESGYNKRPATYISRAGAELYCNQKDARLCAVDELVLAARGDSESQPYPWNSNNLSCLEANYAGSGALCSENTINVDNRPAGKSASEIEQLLGNAAEWATIGEYYVMFGGSYATAASELSLNTPTQTAGSTPDAAKGFRCCRDGWSSGRGDLGAGEPDGSQ